MNIVTVNTSKKYNVYIGTDILKDIGNHAASIATSRKVAIISDTNVWPLYGNKVTSSLQSSNFSVYQYVIPAGEQSKNGKTYLDILNFLAENQLNRSDLLIALGGGVVGDITGFAAATYLRGIAYIQVPTTLLSMVDSSVGGKTAIDLPAGKNLAGAFYQPSIVICDVAALDTLPDTIFRDGCAEVIKYAILYDNELFAHLNANRLSFNREAVITRCVELKRDVVTTDEFDRGNRQFLNLGHTIGHGLEASSNYSISHGQAVSIGLAIIARAAVIYEICSKSSCDNIIGILNAFALPTNTAADAETLFTYALSDKKCSNQTINLIVPETIGVCKIKNTPIDQLLSFIKAGL